MEKKEISVNLETMRAVSANMKNMLEVPYNEKELRELISEDTGDTYNSLSDVRNQTGTCMNVTKQLISCTANFLERAASVFEETDYGIAKEISEK